MSDDPRYPIGPFRYSGSRTEAERAGRIEKIATLPDRLDAVLATLEPADWATPYRPGGWTVRQVVHHLPDSHLHGYGRFMFALAQDGISILPYDEARWAGVVERKDLPPEPSLALLRALHTRWTALLLSLDDGDFGCAIHHPDHNRMITMDELLATYAWHGDHHLAHIESVRGRMR